MSDHQESQQEGQAQNRNSEQSSPQEQQPATVDMSAASPTEETPITHAGNQPSYGIFKRHMRYDPLMVVFTLLVFVGGVIGYFTKQSTASLVAGTIFALLLAVATFIEGTRKNPYPLLVILTALGAMMTYRYTLSYNFMPSGLVALLAFLMVARHIYLTYLRRQTV